MRFWQYLLIVVLGLGAGYAGNHLNSAAQTKAEKTVYERVMETGEIRCGYSLWMPLTFVEPNTGEIKGIFHDLMEEVGKRLGLKITWAEELGWGTVVESVRTHRVDMSCAGYWLNPGRIRMVAATEPQLYAPLYVWARADDTRSFASVADLNNENIMFAHIDGGSSNMVAAHSVPNAKKLNLPEMSTNGDLIESVLNKKADFMIDDITSFHIYNQANPGKLKLLFPDTPLATFPAVMLLPPDDMRFKNMIDSTLKLIELDGTFDRILARYDSSGMFLRNPQPLKLQK